MHEEQNKTLCGTMPPSPAHVGTKDSGPVKPRTNMTDLLFGQIEAAFCYLCVFNSESQREFHCNIFLVMRQ